MNDSWTFGRRLGIAFATLGVLVATVGVATVLTTNWIVRSKDQVIEVQARAVILSERLHADSEAIAAAARGYLLSPSPERRTEVGATADRFTANLAVLDEVAEHARARNLLADVAAAFEQYRRTVDEMVAVRDASGIQAAAAYFDETVVPTRTTLGDEIDRLLTFEEELLADRADEASDSATTGSWMIAIISLIGVVLAMALAVALTRRLQRAIGAPVGDMESAAAELQAAASQQATGAREQSTAMNEITTTINELLATSRQIADGAQRVAGAAQQTIDASRSGAESIGETGAAFEDIRRQVDAVVTHMVELGERSQQIGAVVDIVGELAEQTNIVAINATIEAVGAGEHGVRFGAVAEEIRKLADRVAASTKEIRELVEDVRASVNSTVMATELGAKAVDHGAERFGLTSSQFDRIADTAATTADVADEIELSTKQQSSAVEQLNLAVNNAAQAAKETEASSTQTLATAEQLTSTARDLRALVEPR